jgi:peptidoglycan/LPS O-acetylase OafA/YrhL
MAIVYSRFIFSVKSAQQFYLRRIFRIWPLLWIATVLTILPEVVHTGVLPWKGILVNLTTLFGFIQPTAYLAVGAWSIGNEMVYYLLTPFIFMIYNYHIRAGNLFLILATGVGLFFSFFILDSHSSLSEQWYLYVNPFNNFFLYVLGIAIFYNLNNIRIGKSYIIFGFAILAFIFLQFSGDQIVIVTNFGRVLFVTLSIIIVCCFYKFDLRMPVFLASFLEKIGLSTYGIYILHPIVFQYTSIAFPTFLLLDKWKIFCGVSLITVILSFCLYKWFELPMMKLGKKLTS